MIIDLKKYLTKRTKHVNIASDGCCNPKISGDHDTVILNDNSNMTGCYTLYNTSQGGRCIESTDFGLQTSRHHYIFCKLKSGTNMENKIIPFSFADKTIRTLMINDKPYAVGADVATVLGYVRPSEAVKKHCKGTLKWRIPTDGGEQLMLVIPEGDIFRLITHSKLPLAVKFEQELYDVILPTLYKTGTYALTDSHQLCSSPSYLKAPNLPEPLNCLEFIALDPNYTHERECYWCPVICRCPHYPVSEVAQVATKTSNYLEEILSVMASYPKHRGLLDKVLYDMLYTHRPEDECFNYSMLSKISTKLFQYYTRENEQRNIA